MPDLLKTLKICYPMRFDDIPNTIECQKCGSECSRSIASGGSFIFIAGYKCKKCSRIVSRSWQRLKQEDYPSQFKCPKCGMVASAKEANNDGRVIYEHEIGVMVHQFELERSDDGWGMWRGRAEITRIYETRWDCCIGPG